MEIQTEAKEPEKILDMDVFKALLVTYSASILLQNMPDMKGTLLYSSRVEKELDVFTTVKIRNFWLRDKVIADQAYAGQKNLEKLAYAVTSISQQPNTVQKRFDADLHNLLIRYGVNMFEMGQV